MGRDKASLELAGRQLGERAVDRLKMLCSRVVLCGTSLERLPTLPVLPDELAGEGPLVPLVAALEDSARRGKDTLAVVLAVDLPLVPWELLQWLVSRAHVSGAWATVPLVEDRPQPLCAVYHAALAEPLRKALQNSERKLMRAVESGCATSADIDLFDLAQVMPPSRREAVSGWFLNVNTPEDLLAAERALAERRVW
jgi:molybdopterin-guanine dinucleotide biosynthesis protein A